MKERSSFWDNLRFLLIVSVAIGHYIDVYTAHSAAYRGIFLFIYSFHMYLFVFVSGYFYKDSGIARRCLYYVSVGFLLKITIFLFNRALESPAVFSLLSDGGIPWYMFGITGFTLLTYAFRRLNKRYIMVGFIILACFTGYDRSIGDRLYLSRIIVFYPFYLAGHLTNKDAIIRLRSKISIRLFALIFLSAWAALCYLAVDRIYILRHLFTGRNPFDERILACGSLLRLLTYGISSGTAFSIIMLVPMKPIPCISRWGSRSIDIYFWHYPVYLTIEHFFHISELCVMGRGGKLVYLGISILVSILLAQGGITSYPLNKLKSLCYTD